MRAINGFNQFQVILAAVLQKANVSVLFVTADSLFSHIRVKLHVIIRED